ncbi:MAG: peptidase T [Erysipelotrichaceae bacterium]|nr:peptidase T [Erysipelotrichaceae bacterium]
MLMDKLLDYVRFDTTSHEIANVFPSNEGQWTLAMHLKDELEKLGVKDVILDEYCYVYGYLPGDPNYLTIGLNAHMDTSEQASGENVNPRVIENYDGSDIRLNDNLYTTVKRFPNLNDYIGKTLVVTDGNTLLGADDKAGIAVIMEVLEKLINHPELKHGDIRVCFSPEEEVGRGTEHFNYDLFKVDFAYTIDGAKPDCIEYENFNAASAVVNINGISVHPGSAKDKMVNALQVAHEFHGMLDPDAVPEKTSGYEGFNLLMGLEGEVAKAKMSYIIRNHDLQKLEKQKHDFEIIRDKLNEKYGYEVIDLKLTDSYRNMKEKFIGHEEPIDLVKKAMAEIGLEYKAVAIRGGTDGAALTWNGILCPNLGTGGQNFHGVHEFWCKEDGEKAVELVLKVLSLAEKSA